VDRLLQQDERPGVPAGDPLGRAFGLAALDAIANAWLDSTLAERGSIAEPDPYSQPCPICTLELHTDDDPHADTRY
jgi:hypothetical protein